MIKSVLGLKKYIISIKIEISLLLILCLLSVGGIIDRPLNKETSANQKIINDLRLAIVGINSYQDHTPIIINGNTNFNETAYSEGWIGNGTITNPYMIEGLNITNIGGDIIRIRNTDVHFTIKDCLFVGGRPDGVYFSNVTNAYLFNNTISGCDTAISLTNSNNNTFTHNNLSNNYYYGFELSNSANNTLASNILINLWYGIVNVLSSNNTIFNNTFSNNSNSGLYFGQSGGNRILNNSFSNDGFCFGDGDQLQNYLQTEVANNTVNGKPLVFWQNKMQGTVPSDAGQIILVNSESVNIVEQDISSTHFGISLFFCSNVTISNNSISNNRNGIIISSSNQNRIQNNTFTLNHYGIALYYSSNNDISENTIIHNTGNGFYLYEANGNLIDFNRIYSNNQGLRIFYSNSNALFSNIISDNKIGIDLASSSIYNTIYGNIVSNNSDYAISIGGSVNIIRWNNFINNAPSGTPQVLEYSTQDKNTIEYNYWNDWTQPDINNDGFVDLPYMIDGTTNNSDEYPLSSPFHLSTPVIIFPVGGETVNGIINVMWSHVRDLWNQTVTYALYYSMNSGNSWNLLAADLDSTSFQWDTRTVPDGIDYMVKVNATSSVGLVTEDSSDTIFTILNDVILPPDPPQSLLVIAGELSIQLSWDPPSNDGGSPITTYHVYRGTSSGDYTLIFITSNTTYTDTFVTPLTVYYYVVTAVTTGGESTFSDEESASPNAPGTTFDTSTTTSMSPTSDITTTSQVGSFIGLSFIASCLIISAIVKRRGKRIKN